MSIRPYNVSMGMENVKNKEIKKGNFFKMGNIFVDEYAKVLGKSAVGVYVCLKRHMHNKTRIAFPSEKTIAEKLDMSIRTVQRAIKKLEDYGFIIKQKTKSESQYLHNVYFLTSSKDWLVKLGDKNDSTQATNYSNLSDKKEENYATQSRLNNTNNNNTNKQINIFEKYRPDFMKEPV